MSTGYISEKVPSLGGLTKFGICPKRKDTIDRFYSMWSKHDYPKLKVKKQIQIDEKFKNLLYEWEHQQKIKFKSKQHIVYRKKHIYTTVGEQRYDFIGEKDGPANGGKEFFNLSDKDIKEVIDSLINLEKKIKKYYPI